MPQKKMKEFDPFAYIESAFSDSKVDGSKVAVVPAVDSTPSNTVDGKVRFRKRQLSAPRPRRAKVEKVGETLINAELEEIWQVLPRNIHFLGSFFDDSVTANYYRGEFKESREELIRRLLDPELTLEEVSRLLGVCPATVRRYTNRNWLSHHRTKGGQRRFRLSGVVKFVETHGRHPEE
ncbi:MAG: helix-turn-helix domain-containing protein [Chthonomonas sp.]|nr:helix-turn-helix domain-containing protein [Chthonomonas sp.]